jgi:hypothetical protein
MATRKVIAGGGGLGYSTGGSTNNVIPKNDGAGGLKDSSITDNGTTVTTTEPIVVPDTAGSGVPSVKGATATTGIYMNGGTVGMVSTTAGWASTGGTAATSLQLPVGGILGWSTSASIAAAGSDTFLGKRSTANFRFGAADLNGTPVDQTISVQNAITGSDLPGGHFTIDAPLGTGLGATSKVSINRAIMKATGATAQTATNAFAVGQSKTLSNTSATAQTVATITLGSNAGGGCAGTFTLVATDGTNFDSETQSFTVSFVNKATVVTVGTPAITTSTAANNSGSATLGITAVASGNDIAIKVTPVFTTIVPTTVTLYPIITHSTGTVTFS